MAEFDVLQEASAPLRRKEAPQPETDTLETAKVSKAIEHGRPEALGTKGALHLQRAAGNAAMGSLVQRAPEEDNPVHRVVGSGGGSALDPGVQQKMESTLGHDFSDVRVHTGSDAAAAAKSVQAQAFTVGNDVVFNEGKYSPSTADGQRTIAHELTHVVQQGKGDVPGESIGGGVKLSDPGDWAERQAEATADAVMSSGDSHAGHDHAGSAGGRPSVQRDEVAPEEASAQALSIQRAEAGAEEVEEEPPAQTLRDDTVQREEDDELD